ncbi:hypothetical protein AMTR_s00070p00141130 [Amborella trichopoda]|uniref:Uncharacterized protein n=1 Tax=Amborella trichopoda TaxID=13333 RepID=U5DDL1_AMBTC|nr:hypothetical protein AMTR_s00070p00141130 [Amborella trichopoda]
MSMSVASVTPTFFASPRQSTQLSLTLSIDRLNTQETFGELWMVESDPSLINQRSEMQDLETVGSLEESVLSVLDLRALMQIFGKVPSCHLSSPHDPDNLALMPFLL